MGSQVYNVPVILPDLRKEESYYQIVDALEYLDAVANDIFSRITFRVAESRDKLVLINNRIFTAQAKIDKLRSASSKAARVFSSPKYPAPTKITDYCSIYKDVHPRLQKVRKTKTQIDSRLPEVTEEVLRTKSRLIPMAPSRKRHGRERSHGNDTEIGEGLGRLPRHLPSVSSLLLFNTDENPYKKYVLLDPLEGAKTKTRDKIIEEENELAEAPITITRGEELGRAQQDSIMYVPLMPELSQLDVPDMLPQLQYVASDVFYSGDVGASIAPSLANNAVPDLPNIVDPLAPTTVIDVPLPPATTTAPPPPPPLPNRRSTPPLPPPQPVVQAPFLPTVGDSEDSSEEAVGIGNAIAGSPDVGNGRATLMDAIRKAGGASKAGLKNAKSLKHKRKARKAKESSSPGDLLGDLSAALGRRRKALSGKDRSARDRDEKRDEHNLGGGAMMDNISKMIPPPPSSSTSAKGLGESLKGIEDSGAW